ncbi:hypothetical protein WDU94_005607 [Cyamophila willieti]
MGKLRGKYNPRNIPAIQDPLDPNKLVHDPIPIANSLAAHFSSVSSDNNYSPEFLMHKNECERNIIHFDFSLTDDYNSPFSYKELSSVLISCSSKAAGPDGISFVLLKELPIEALYKLLDLYNFIWISELMGIFLCLLNIQFLPATRFLVVSDSMSALEAIKSNNYNNPLISKIYNQWVKLETYGKYLSFMWCPSHIGIKGNEAVDQAASNPSLTLNPIKACSDQDFKPLIAKIIKTRWQNSWNSIPSTNKLKQTKPLVDPWDSSNRNTRVEEVVLTRVRIGHTRLTHSYLFTRSPQPTCNCGESLTVKHILTCPTHAQLRTTLPCPPLPIDNTKSCDALIYYLKSINLFHRI